jgi:hypothetical protein
MEVSKARQAPSGRPARALLRPLSRSINWFSLFGIVKLSRTGLGSVALAGLEAGVYRTHRYGTTSTCLVVGMSPANFLELTSWCRITRIRALFDWSGVGLPRLGRSAP